MRAPRNFLPEHAIGENYIIDPDIPDHVIVYRFGDTNKPLDWRSRKRQAIGSNFARPTDNDLNNFALLQASGANSGNSAGNPLIPVATSHEVLFKNGDGWVRKILAAASNLVMFSVPFTSVFRPSPLKPLSRKKTEWLYYNGDQTLTRYQVEVQANPYKE